MTTPNQRQNRDPRRSEGSPMSAALHIRDGHSTPENSLEVTIALRAKPGQLLAVHAQVMLCQRSPGNPFSCYALREQWSRVITATAA